MKKFPKSAAKEFGIFKRLNSPAKIQNFINSLPFNFENGGDTCRSPLLVLKHRTAHCMEGAMLAAAILWFHEEKPILLDLRTKQNDDDHVVALFKRNGKWGAISKTNHGVLRYRDPIYKSPRELAVSYFNEYFLDNGEKTLRNYSSPFSLLRYGKKWLTQETDLWNVYRDLDKFRHFPILDKKDVRNLRKADKIEINANDYEEWNRKGKRVY